MITIIHDCPCADANDRCTCDACRAPVPVHCVGLPALSECPTCHGDGEWCTGGREWVCAACGMVVTRADAPQAQRDIEEAGRP